jgi:hypothetical protein
MVPELSVDAADMMSGEYERVVAYGAKGDVADLNDLIVYVESLIHVLRERRLVV